MAVKGIALITGASSGIGEATALALATDGYTVALAARRADLLDQLAERIRATGGNAICFTTDMCVPEQVEELAQAVQAQLGPIDVLINNAGVGAGASAWRLTDEQITSMLATNLIAPIQLTRAVLPAMLERGRGSIINIGSVAGHIATPGSTLYAASKFGLRAWNDGLRREVRRRGIHVSLVAPGYIRTPMTAGRGDRFMPGPELVAQAIVGLLRRPRRELVVPWYYSGLIWLAERAPWLMDLTLSWSKKRPG